MVTWTALAVFVLQLAGAQPGQAQDPRGVFQRDVDKRLEVAGAARLRAQIAWLVSNQVIEAIRHQQPAVPAKASEVIKEVLNAEFGRAFEPGGTLRQKTVEIQGTHFTHVGLKVQLDFYDTPVGRKAVAVMPLAASLQERERAEGFIK
jgi:hypothetical protein